MSKKSPPTRQENCDINSTRLIDDDPNLVVLLCRGAAVQQKTFGQAVGIAWTVKPPPKSAQMEHYLDYVVRVDGHGGSFRLNAKTCDCKGVHMATSKPHAALAAFANSEYGSVPCCGFLEVSCLDVSWSCLFL